jgi:hypothetical protein
MRRSLAFLAGIAICVVLGLYLAHHSPPQAAPSRTVESQNAAVAAALAAQNSNTVALIQSNFANVKSASPVEVVAGTAAQIATAPAGPATQPQLVTLAPQTAVENMSRMIKQYGQMFGGNPVGNNAEFAKQLGGDNPKHINFINSEAGMRLDGNGQLVDPWGTPYFFHQISGSDTEVRSAGPDKVMYTADDIVVQ